ncbi:hypothetical protein BOTBODRAFT_434118 [Botryobasidium botryosum FD-172 SS1]|uniref:Uncharacterized protein n=1 Tax=Botryobasidium botryosum (strain FD-172 SS1) TaxID=930990 RepID=A0A067N572_BOTB1|nr:hypothetical protein BOTBODRAFT_434118 [Botryobasidium botryosum FD-172 SS1]
MFRSSIRRMTLLVPRPSRAAPTFSRIPITRPLSSTSTHIATSPFTRPPRGAFSSQSGRHASVRMFHASRRNEGVPVWLLLILKSSSGLGLTQALGRITFSLIPLTMIQNRVLNKLLMARDD